MLILERFFADLDARWTPTSAEILQLRIIGSAALMLQADYERGTKNSDVIETEQLTGDTKGRLIALAGEGSIMHRRHRLYVDIVPSGLPFLPRPAKWNPLTRINASLRFFELMALDVVDVVVSKLKRLNPNDISDIDAMIDCDLVHHSDLIDRFKSAVDWYLIDARALDLPKYIENLNRVERDLLVVDETVFDLPGWIDRTG